MGFLAFAFSSMRAVGLSVCSCCRLERPGDLFLVSRVKLTRKPLPTMDSGKMEVIHVIHEKPKPEKEQPPQAPDVKEDKRTAAGESSDLEILKRFPDGAKRYILHRIAGMDVLEPVQEHEAEGCLVINKSNETAMLYVRFPSNKGILAARLDYTGPRVSGRDGEPPTFFRASACKAYVNYGLWKGMVHRDGDDIGTNFFGSCMTFGVQVAEVGRKDVKAENPFVFETIHSFELKGDELEPDESEKDELPKGYKSMKSGYIGMTLFFVDESDHYASGMSAPVPLGLWFRPQSEGDDTVSIPSNIVEEIGKLPPWENKEQQENNDETVVDESQKRKSEWRTGTRTRRQETKRLDL